MEIKRPGKLCGAAALITAALLVTVLGMAQTAPRLTFEVTSVKVNKSGDRGWEVQYLPGGRFSARNIPLGFLIFQEAYHIEPSRMSAGTDPAKLDPDKAMALRFDIEAVAAKDAIPSGSSDRVLKEKLRLMLQSLLADRFKLAVHHEVKEQPVFALLVAKGGPKFQKSAVQEKDCADHPASVKDTAACHIFEGGGPADRFHGRAVEMSDMAKTLSDFAGRLVIDKTGLTGLFDIQMAAWAPLRPPLPPGTEDNNPETRNIGGTMFDMLDLLGLKVDAQTAPVEVLVLDHVERPLEN
jgi:uncharacterized protein (TIGR03435 family)